MRSYLAGDSHDVVFGRAGATEHHLVLTGEHPVGAPGFRGGRLIQDADGAVLPDAVRDFVGVHPERELAGQELVELREAESDLARCLADNGVHFVVDADAAVAGAFEGFLGKPVVFVVLCKGKREGGSGEQPCPAAVPRGSHKGRGNRILLQLPPSGTPRHRAQLFGCRLLPGTGVSLFGS